MAKYDKTTAIRTGLGIGSARGELTLVVAKAGQDVGAISSAVLPILGVITIISTFMTPYVLRLGNKLKFKSIDKPNNISLEADKSSPPQPPSSPSPNDLPPQPPSSSVQEQENSNHKEKNYNQEH
jgi:CPA2 family monovalent cation:H+ antiporter-2